MMMKKQRGRRPSKPKGKGLLWYLRRNAKPRKLEKINKTTRRKEKKEKEKGSDRLKKDMIHFNYLYLAYISNKQILHAYNFLCHLRVLEIFYCAFESSIVIEKFMFDKIEDSKSTNERWIGQILDKLSRKSTTFFQRFIEIFSGYKGWRFFVPPMKLT